MERLGAGFPETDQESVEEPPPVIVEGDAPKREIEGEAGELSPGGRQD
jgi:hypothetical protein